MRRRSLRGSKTVTLFLLGVLLVSCEASNSALAARLETAVDRFMADHLVAGVGVALIQW